MNVAIFDRVKKFIDQYNLIPKSSTVIVGLSGGPDSIFLLHFLTSVRKEKKLNLIAAHLDHQWREESKNDVKFCQEVASKLEVVFAQGTADKLSSQLKFNGSKEELGRRMRRHFLESVAHEYQADRIALAHHLQDQEETFFIRLIRGTTLSGLTSMRPHHGIYIRPLLEINKSDILAYLNDNKISYLTDPTNILPTFLRNRIRHEVLPALVNCDKRFDQNFLRTLNHLKDAESELIEATKKIYLMIVKTENNLIKLNLKNLFTFSTYMQKRLIMHWLIDNKVPFVPQESFLDELLKFFSQPKNGSHVLHETWKVIKIGEYTHIEHTNNQKFTTR